MRSERFADLKPNDPKGALEFAKQEMRAGRWTRDLAHTLTMMQDDCGAMAGQLNELAIAEGVSLN